MTPVEFGPRERRRQQSFIERPSVAIVILVAYAVLQMVQLRQVPLERYPGWDYFWADSLLAGKLETIKLALHDREVPAFTPYLDFGHNLSGDAKALTPFASPINWLIAVLPVQTVILVRTLIYWIIGTIGAYLYLRFLTKNHFLSLLGGICYIAIPCLLTNEMYYFTIGFFPIPAILLTIHHALREAKSRTLVLFVALCFLTFTAADIYFLIILPAVVVLYAMTTALFYEELPAWTSIRRVSTVTVLCLLAASFYILPLYNNLQEIKLAERVLEESGIAAPPTAISVREYLQFFSTYGLPTLYKPIDGSAMFLYVPTFMYLAILVGLTLRRSVFARDPRMATAAASLFGAGVLMFVLSLVFYSLPSSISTMGKGVLRYHLNLIPFMNVLAAFVCLGGIAQAGDLRRPLFTLVMLGSLVFDIFVLVVPAPRFDPADEVANWFYVDHTPKAMVSSNLVPVRVVSDMYQMVPWINVSLLALAIAAGRLGEEEHESSALEA